MKSPITGKEMELRKEVREIEFRKELYFIIIIVRIRKSSLRIQY